MEELESVDSHYDFFISHASEDKESFVRSLAEELIARGYKVWYDEFTLKLGDSLVNRISEGIKKSTFGLIVLSKNFFSKNWTKKELEALLNKEVIMDSDIILPIWLDVDVKEVYEYSALLVNKVAVKAKSGNLEGVIQSIEKKTRISLTTVNNIRDKIEYLKNAMMIEEISTFLMLKYELKASLIIFRNRIIFLTGIIMKKKRNMMNYYFH